MNQTKGRQIEEGTTPFLCDAWIQLHVGLSTLPSLVGAGGGVSLVKLGPWFQDAHVVMGPPRRPVWLK